MLNFFEKLSLFQSDKVIEAYDYPAGHTNKISEHWFVSSLSSVLLIFLGSYIGTFYNKFVNPESFTGGWSTVLFYCQTICILIIALLFMGITKNNRVFLKYIRPGQYGNSFSSFICWLIIGVLTNAICVLCAYLFGGIKFDIGPINPLAIIAGFGAIVVQACSEEVIFRCYLFKKLQRKYKMPILSIALSAAIFSVIHTLNPGVNVLMLTNVFLSGIIMSMIVFYWNSFWAAVSFHAAWNFTQNIIFGLPNSGYVSDLHIFKLCGTIESSFAYNTTVGIEGSVTAVIIQLFVVILLIIIGEIKMKKVKYAS